MNCRNWKKEVSERCLMSPCPRKPCYSSEEAPYGYCPACGGKGVSRERRIDGFDKCENGHYYSSKSATPPRTPAPTFIVIWLEEGNGDEGPHYTSKVFTLYKEAVEYRDTVQGGLYLLGVDIGGKL
jgi:hypothetical protein